MVNKIFDFYKPLIENRIDELLPETDLAYNEVIKAARYSLKLGGKRIRPIIMMEFCKLFGGKAEEAVVALKTADGYTALAIQQENFMPDETWSDRDINIVFTMQEALNTVLENLLLEDVDVLLPTQAPAGTSQTDAQTPQQKPQEAAPGPAELPESMKEDLAIDTPYMELHYPSKWADNLSIQVQEENGFAVGYYCSIGDHADLQLFTVYFGGEVGAPLKTFKTEAGETVEVRIEVPELSMDSSWTEEEKSLAYAMQEDLNYLIGKLSG